MAKDREPWIPFHLRIGAVLGGLGDDVFTANARRLHTAFYELQKANPELFPGMTFSILSTYPYSKELRSALFRLQQSDALSADNPKWVRYQIQRRELKRKLDDLDVQGKDTINRLTALGVQVAPKLALTEEEGAATPA